jgi:hypothetical protein
MFVAALKDNDPDLIKIAIEKYFPKDAKRWKL